ncbi:MAG: hypothetical protein EOO15_24910 [Chitinophagaceae bacterium]|nr:MAG: hypothetical protein EOO15_24910 [Chitinophagaceae bacterium]
MKRSFLPYILFFGLAVALLSSCKVTQPYQSPEMTVTDLYRGVATNDTASIAYLPWNQLFTDTLLQRHIQAGISRNLDLQTAYTRIQQARSYYAQSGAAFLPSLDANTGVTVSKLSEAQGFGIRTSATQYHSVSAPALRNTS